MIWKMEACLRERKRNDGDGGDIGVEECMDGVVYLYFIWTILICGIW